MQIAITGAKEDGLQIGLGDAVKPQLLSRSWTSATGFGTLGPSEYLGCSRIDWLGLGQRSVLELNAPVVFGDMSGFADAQRRRICRLATSLPRTSGIIAGCREKRCEKQQSRIERPWHGKERSVTSSSALQAKLRKTSQPERPSTLVIHTNHTKTRYPSLIDLRSQLANLLEDERKQFRASLPENPGTLWKN